MAFYSNNNKSLVKYIAFIFIWKTGYGIRDTRTEVRQQYNNEIDPNATILISENDRRPLRYFKIDQKHVLFISPVGFSLKLNGLKDRPLVPSWSGYF